METLLAMAAGAIMGSGAARTHAWVDGSWWLNLLAGAAGGHLGAMWWADALEPHLADSSLAAIATAGAAGGALVAVIVGAARRLAFGAGRRAGRARDAGA